MKVRVVINGEEYEVEVEEIMPGKFKVTLEGETYEVEAKNLGIRAIPTPTTITPPTPQSPTIVPTPQVPQVKPQSKNIVTAPMPGKILKILVKEGQEVKLGQGLLILEAMKMENEIPAPRNGVVKRILVKEGDSVDTGQPLIELG